MSSRSDLNARGITSTRLASSSGTASPSTRRVHENVPKPLWTQLPKQQCIDSSGAPNLKNIILHFLREGRLKEEDAISIAQRAAVIFRNEPNTLAVEAPATVVGDIHGQLYDLAKILTVGGRIGETKYLFLGNYTGKSGFGCECVLLLLAAKIVYPEHILLLRGNHESIFMTQLLGFEQECLRKYSRTLYKELMATFNTLPLAALISEKYFCVHGGLSPDIARIKDMQYIYRFCETPTKGAMCDLLWSDPHYDVENPAGASSTDTEYYTPGTGAFELEPSFFANAQQGCSYLFNFACVKHFANVNKLLCIIRGNEVQDSGYKLYRPHPNNHYPSMIGVFSAPNYCDTFDNKGAILRVTKESINITQFFCSPHPYSLDGQDSVTWSFPFLLDHIESSFVDILGLSAPSQDKGGAGTEDEEEEPHSNRAAARAMPLGKR